MRKFRTHLGPKTATEIFQELGLEPRNESANVLVAEMVPFDEPARPEEVQIGMTRYEAKPVTAISAFNRDPVSVPKLDDQSFLDPTGLLGVSSSSGTFTAQELPPVVALERAEVALRKAVRRCFKEGVPLERIREIFRLELVEVVHDD